MLMRPAEYITMRDMTYTIILVGTVNIKAVAPTFTVVVRINKYRIRKRAAGAVMETTCTTPGLKTIWLATATTAWQ